MTDTTRLGLPLLAPAQAQKHVTVNEALGRLDAVVRTEDPRAAGVLRQDAIGVT